MNAAQQLVRIAAGLVSEEAENSEYDRACAEIVTEFLGFPMDCKGEILGLIRSVAL